MKFLGLEGGVDGARLAMLFWQWFHDPDKLLSIYAYSLDSNSMVTRQLYADTATIFIGKAVVAGFKPGDIALLGHELEHVSQGTWQAWSIQGEVLAYQVEFRIRESMGVRQSSYTNGAMGIFEDHTRASYDASSYHELLEARTGFLDPQGGLVDYNVWYEPNLPWPQETDHQAWQAAVRKSLITNAGSLIHPSPR